jgi:arsenical pump membrane protein
MDSTTMIMTVFAFLFTLMLIFWRPRGLNEAVPATIGAVIVILSGSVSFIDLIDITNKISGAALTIISSLVMALVLESVGFFQLVAIKLTQKANGSGIKLFLYTNLLCFLMTVFFNNDGSIIITTPILLLIVNRLHLKKHQKLPYLISGALIATASSAPIGVSNIVNLIALKIINMDLYLHTAMMFVPSMMGLLFLFTMLFIVFYKDIPKKIPATIYTYNIFDHPLKDSSYKKTIKITMKQMSLILLFVFIVRISLFIASYFGIPEEIVSITGSVMLLAWRWYYFKIKPYDLLIKAPWHILLFAFGMYVVIYGLHNTGLTTLLISQIKHYVVDDLFKSIFIMGGALSVLSNIFNNHPALMVGTIALTEMNLNPIILKSAYLANIIGSDIGSLLLPTGTLATLLWMHILKKNNYKISWSTYMKVTFIVIPPTVIFTLIALYYWVLTIFGNNGPTS